MREGRSLGQSNLRNSGNPKAVDLRAAARKVRKTYKAQEQEEAFMKPLINPLMKIPRQGTPNPEDPEGDGEDYKDYEFESEAMDMLYSCNWQPMQPLARPRVRQG